jgi:hypothetical protein
MVKNSKGIIPGKLFEYLAAGKPILAIAEDDKCDVAVILSDTKGGLFFSRENLKGLSNFLESLPNNFEFIPNIEAINNYNRKTLTEKLVSIIP